MRSFQQLVVLLFAALFAFAYAQEDASYDATVYVTSTVYRVNTVTMPGTPTGTVSIETSTISASIPAGTGYGAPSYSGNGTSIAPTGALPSTTAPPFEGAASSMGVNGVVAILAAGMAYLAL